MRRLAYAALIVTLAGAPACTSRNPAASGDARLDTLQGKDAPRPGDGPVSGDGPATSDGPTTTDGPLGSDGPVTTDGPLSTDGPVRTDGPVTTDGPLGSDLPNCAAVQCPAPTCQVDATSGVCKEQSSSCDPSTGTCNTVSRSVSRNCTQNGSNCIQRTPGCTSNLQCVTVAQIIKGTCNPATGVCTPSVGKCKVDCDCNQGLLCSNGSCIAGFVPAYCCDKSGCPANQRCTDSNGNPGYCPGSNACVSAGGICVVQFSPCPFGYKRDATLNCGGALSLDCCAPSP
ncbi:MAG: hypothetical protein KC503_06575 [Myxococcales bacterium]|nr:hypothetical protein [Myxococcales bacterium]